MAGGQLLWILVLHLVLTGLPGVAAVLFAARRGVDSVPLLLAIALAVSGGLAMLAFWAYYADRVLGESLSYFTILGSVGLIAWSVYGGRLDRKLLRQLATPLALWVLGSAFIVYFGFLHGGTDQALGMAMYRFGTPMPNDNAIPFFFGEWFFDYGHGAPPPPFSGDWLASDRPPLQTGYLLARRPLGGWHHAELQYQVLGVILQQLWIVGLWALLLAARVGRLTRALVMVAVLLSPVAIVNGFFVWPKLLPAGLLLAAAALLMTPLWERLRQSLWGAVLLAALFGLAMLSHGSSIFGIVPLALFAAWRGLPSWRWIGVALAVGFVLLAPWSAYQKWGEPPGNRLIKWQLAGVIDLDDRGAGETLIDSYSEAGLGGTIHNKGQNFVVISGGGPMAEHLDEAAGAVADGDWELFAEDFRNIFFFNLVPSLGLLLFALPALLLGRRRAAANPREWSFALGCFAVFAIGAVFWALLLFGNEAARTVIHQGSYLLPILGLCGVVVGLRALFPRFALWFVAVNAALMLALYTPSFDPPPGSSYSLFAALAAVAALAGFVSVARRWPG
ncbi:MAG TPA: hypothetical protein VFX85_01015 [Solirubrobacterales bacterium]|nr:hypothetical protein [Solirubrobacterales bacterium]